MGPRVRNCARAIFRRFSARAPTDSLVPSVRKEHVLCYDKILLNFMQLSIVKLDYFYLQTQASHVVSIPKEHHRFILGKGGSKLQELETKTATKISIPKVT